MVGRANSLARDLRTPRPLRITHRPLHAQKTWFWGALFWNLWHPTFGGNTTKRETCLLCSVTFSKSESKLFFCSANKKNGRGCRKKICDRCLSRKFPDLYKPEDKMLNKWKCPSCLNRCPCASCRMCDHGCSRKRCLDQTCSHYR
eukprot:g48970.t1